MPMYKDINIFGIKTQNFRIVILNLPGLSVKRVGVLCTFSGNSENSQKRAT